MCFFPALKITEVLFWKGNGSEFIEFSGNRATNKLLFTDKLSIKWQSGHIKVNEAYKIIFKIRGLLKHARIILFPWKSLNMKTAKFFSNPWL